MNYQEVNLVSSKLLLLENVKIAKALQTPKEVLQKCQNFVYLVLIFKIMSKFFKGKEKYQIWQADTIEDNTYLKLLQEFAPFLQCSEGVISKYK